MPWHFEGLTYCERNGVGLGGEERGGWPWAGRAALGALYIGTVQPKTLGEAV